jgi:hypothetical protein
MISADEFVNYIAPEVAECPNLVIKRAVTSAAQDFFRETNLWTVECDPVDSDPGEPIVELDIPANTLIGKVISLYIDKREIEPMRPDDVAAGWMERTGTIGGYWLSGARTLRLYPACETSQSIHAFVSVIPAMNCTSFDDIANQYFQGIVHGAKWKLMATVGTPYFNEQGAAYNYAQFRRIAGDARVRASRKGHAPMRVNLGVVN